MAATSDHPVGECIMFRPLTSRRPTVPALATFILAGLALAPIATRAQAGYRQPPAVVAQILDAPATPSVMLSPDGTRMVLFERPGLPPISEIAAPEYRVAGIRLNP